jgi:formate hydrogenlyase subunit 4
MFYRILFNLFQIFVVLAFAPLASGVLSRLKEMVQSKRGPSIFQPYLDLWKLLHKDEIVSEESSWIFRFTPYIVFVAPIFVTLLIPVLTNYPLFFAFMGDMLGGGFVLSLGGFFAALAAVDTANPYGPMGASRTRMVGFLAEPVFMIVFFTVSFVAGSTIAIRREKDRVHLVEKLFFSADPIRCLLVCGRTGSHASRALQCLCRLRTFVAADRSRRVPVVPSLLRRADDCRNSR